MQKLNAFYHEQATTIKYYVPLRAVSLVQK